MGFNLVKLKRGSGFEVVHSFRLNFPSESEERKTDAAMKKDYVLLSSGVILDPCLDAWSLGLGP